MLKNHQAYHEYDVCHYIITYSNEIGHPMTNLRLQKLLYLIQIHFLTEKNRPCFQEKIELLDFGPVVANSYNRYKHHAECYIPNSKTYTVINEGNIWDAKEIEFDESVITDDDKKSIREIINKFINYSTIELLKLIRKQEGVQYEKGRVNSKN